MFAPVGRKRVRSTGRWLLVGVVAAQSGRALAQSSEGVEAPASSGANAVNEPEHGVDLASEILDPTASLLNVNVLYDWTIDHYPSEAGVGEGDSHAITFRPVIPFPAWGATNILRVSVPYEIENESGEEGLGETEIVDFVAIEQSWGRWAPGVVVNLVPHAGSEESPDSLQGGPAFALVVTAVREWTLGVFSQNLFSDDVQVSFLQPVVGYAISPTLSLSIGEPQVTWDWDAGELVAAPVGVQLNVVVPILGQPLRLSANPQVNLIDDPGLKRWSLIFGVGLPVAK